MRYGRYAAGVHDEVQVALLGCSAHGFGGEVRAEIEILDIEFFDEETLILVYRAKDTGGKANTFRLYPSGCIDPRMRSRRDTRRYGKVHHTRLPHTPIGKIRKRPRASRYDGKRAAKMEGGACKSRVVAMFLLGLDGM